MGTIVYVDGFDDYTTGTFSDRGWNGPGWNTIVAGRVAGLAVTFYNRVNYRVLEPDTRYSAGFAWRTDNATAAQGTMFSFFESGTVHSQLAYNGDGTFSVKRDTTVLATSANQSILANTWYHLEFDLTVNDTTGAYEVRLNGVAIIGPTTGADTRNGGTGVINQLRMQMTTASTHSYDDMVLTKGGGFHGDCRVITQYPSADGANTAWARTELPRVQAGGTPVSGAADITVAWPAHEPGDIGLLFVEACGGQAIALGTAAGFVEVANSPQATGSGTAGTRIAVFWCRATSSAMASPVVTDPGDHAYGQIITFRGCLESGDPIDVTGGGVKAIASTSFTATGVTTGTANCVVVVAVARDNDDAGNNFSGWTNAGLVSVSEWSDVGTTSGNGGGFGVAGGIKTAAGATGDTTGVVTNSINAFITVALKMGTADYTAVDDSLIVAGHDSDLTYISSATPDDRETFDFPALGVTGTTKAVVIQHLSRKNNAGSRKIAGCIRRGSTNYDGTAIAQSVTYVGNQAIYEQDPSTAASWLVANIDAGEFGVVVKS